MFTQIKSRIVRAGLLAGLALVSASSAHATTFSFATDPFAGSNAPTTPGRQVVGNELFIPNFNLATDVMEFNSSVYGLNRPLKFASGSQGSFAGSNANFIVLQDIDADLNPANDLLNNAGLSANAIAASGIQSGAGFFLYFNTVLNVNRLVYSTDLASKTADLKILARFTEQTGARGAAALLGYTGGNVVGVPEPATWAMMIFGFGAVGSSMRSRRKNQSTLLSLS